MSKGTLAPVSAVPAIADMTTDDLRAELATALGLSARSLLRTAAIWAELERRGEDLSPLRSGIMAYLPLIAAGAVLPETVVLFAGSQTHLRAVASLPADQQRRIADGEPVPMAVNQGGQFTFRLLPVHALTASQVRQVFGERCVRSEAEQIALLTAQSPDPAAGPGRPPKRGKATADRKQGLIRVGRYEVPAADALAALADLAGEAGDEPGPNAPTVGARVTDAEHERLRLAAARAKTTVAQLIRNALRAAGMI